LSLGDLLPSPAARRRLVAAAAARCGEASLLVAAGTDALPLTSMLAGALGVPMAYLRPKPKTHGRQQRVEGELRGPVTLLVAQPDLEALRDYAELVATAGATLANILVLEGDPSSLAGLHVPVATLDGTSAPELPSAPTSAAGAPSAGVVARMLLDIGAVMVRQEPFRYASGLLSPIYTDCRLLISHPAEWQAILAGLAARLEGASFDAIDGVATSGIPHASVLAYRLDKPLAYVDGGAVAGSPPAGCRLVVVEDLVTTGKSVLEATQALRAAGLEAGRCLAIFTYDRRQPSLEAAGIDLEPLSDLPTLLEAGVETGAFGPQERDAVLAWWQDPEGWTARHEARSL
jgi:orotate phosphoribosyltransferase